MLTFATQNNIKDAASIIDEVCEAASHWTEISKECGVPSVMTDAIVANMMLNI
jgi:serine/threonine-protein kinase HipA